MISLKKEKDLDHLRVAGQLVADVLILMEELVCPGVDTLTLDRKAEEMIRDAGGEPAFKGYRVPGIPTAFPGTLCVSINEEIVHGIPSESRLLKEGDIVSIDVGTKVNGYFGDAARTFPVGEVADEWRKLLDVTRLSLESAIDAARDGNTVGDIGHAVEQIVAPYGFGIVRDYAGHGIGARLHEPPQIPNYGVPGSGITLKKGMTIAIEPMIMLGAEKVKTLSDRWTVVTADGSPAAHFEKSIAITEGEPEILTPWDA